MYLASRATGVHPMGVTEHNKIARLVERMGVPTKVWVSPDDPLLDTLGKIGAARGSVAASR